MKTFKELVDSGEWNQGRYDALSRKYTHLLYAPTRNKIKALFEREALSTPNGMATVLYSMIEMVANKIVQDVLMMLLQDESVTVHLKPSKEGGCFIMDCPCPSCTLQRLTEAIRETRKILLEESHELDIIAHSKGIPEEYHAQIENISTRLIEPLTLFRKAYLMSDWTKFDEETEKSHNLKKDE